MEQVYVRVKEITIPHKLAKTRNHQIAVKVLSNPNVIILDLYPNAQRKGLLTCSGFCQFLVAPNAQKNEKIEFTLLCKRKKVAQFALPMSYFNFQSIGKASFDLQYIDKDYRGSRVLAEVHYTDGYTAPFGIPYAPAAANQQPPRIQVSNSKGGVKVLIDPRPYNMHQQYQPQNQGYYNQYPQQQQYPQYQPYQPQYAPKQQAMQYQQQAPIYQPPMQPQPVAPVMQQYYQVPNAPPQYPNPPLINPPQPQEMKPVPHQQPIKSPYNDPPLYPQLPTYPQQEEVKAPVNLSPPQPYNYNPRLQNYQSPQGGADYNPYGRL